MLGNIMIYVKNSSNKASEDINKTIDIICKLTFTPQKMLFIFFVFF